MKSLAVSEYVRKVGSQSNSVSVEGFQGLVPFQGLESWKDSEVHHVAIQLLCWEQMGFENAMGYHKILNRW